jgi:hypothetical protein
MPVRNTRLVKCNNCQMLGRQVARQEGLCSGGQKTLKTVNDLCHQALEGSVGESADQQPAMQVLLYSHSMTLLQTIC